MTNKLITTPSELYAVYRKLESYKGFLSFDSETYGPTTDWVKKKTDRIVWDYTAKLADFSFSFQDESYNIPAQHSDIAFDPDILKRFIKAFFKLPNRIWAHNIDYDSRVIANYIGEYQWPERMGDTMILCWILGRGVRTWRNGKEVYLHGLKDLVKHHFMHDMSKYKDTIKDFAVLTEGPDDALLERLLKEKMDEIIANRAQLSLVAAPPTAREMRSYNAYKKKLLNERTYRDAQMNELPAYAVLDYACEDAFWANQLATRFWPEMQRMNYVHQWDALEMPILKIIRDMHDTGLIVDESKVHAIKEFCRPVMEPLVEEFKELTGADITSSQQCGYFFFGAYQKYKLEKDPETGATTVVPGRLVYPGAVWPAEDAPMTKGGVPAINYESLMWAKHVTKDDPLSQKLIDMKLRYAEVAKLATTYTDSVTAQLPFSPDGRVRPRYNQTGTNTGRFSSSNPFNAQNFPKKSDNLPDIREAFTPPPGFVYGSLDFSQIEIVLVAHYSQDEKLRDIILSGKSMHDVTAAALQIERNLAKCLSTESLVYRNNVHPIRLADVKVTERLIGGNVSHIFDREEKRAVLVLTQYGGAICSEDHKWPVEGRGDVQTKDLSLGDTLPKSVLEYEGSEQSVNLGLLSLKVTEDFAYVAGAFLGDGCVSDSQILICGGYKNEEYQDWVKALEEKVVAAGFSTHVNLNRKQGMAYVHVRHAGYKGAVQMFKALRLVQEMKDKKQPQRRLRVPDYVLSSMAPVRLAFLAGLVDTDGTVDKYGSISITTKDPQFALDIQCLVSSLGVLSSIEACFNKKYFKYYYRVRIQKSLNNSIRPYLLYSKKKERATACKQQQKVKHNAIKKIISLPDKIEMVDIEVDHHKHEFVVQGLWTKNCLNFLKNYGGGARKLALSLNVPLEEKVDADGIVSKVAPQWVKNYCDGYDKLYSGVTTYRETMAQIALRYGYVETLLGRRRTFPDLKKKKEELKILDERFRKGSNMRKYKPTEFTPDMEKLYQELKKKRSRVWAEVAGVERQASNAPIQGSAADIIKLAMVAIYNDWKERGSSNKIVMQIHDELVFFLKEDTAEKELDRLKEIMVNVVKLSLPISATGGLGKNWSECK